jgi:hypothetical protein
MRKAVRRLPMEPAFPNEQELDQLRAHIRAKANEK